MYHRDMDKNIIKWIWFALAAVPGSSNAAKILELNDEIDELYERTYDAQDHGVSQYVIDALNQKDLSAAEQIYEYCLEHDILPVPIFDRRYPSKLREIIDPPALLYFKGQIPVFDENVLIGVVGTRECTDYGFESTLQICDGLARSGIIIVSGMAKGIDGTAATAALNANAFTIAVLGNGVDVIYPPENEALYYQIKQRGLLISEYPPLSHSTRRTFPERNRIISGLCDGVLVVEADLKSGALITADKALHQGRNIYAVPGDIDREKSKGTNRLIQNGAKMVTDANDIIVEHQFAAPKSLRPVTKRDFERLAKEKAKRKKGKPIDREQKKQPEAELLSAGERAICNLLADQKLTQDQIADKCGFDAAKTAALLMMLVIKNKIRELPGNRYTRN